MPIGCAFRALMAAVKVVDPTGPGPGMDKLDGDLDLGYFGEVSHSDLISGDDLAATSGGIGLIAGIGQNSEAGWLKFAHNEKILFIAKRPFRYDISWNQINGIGAAFGDSGECEEFEIGDYKYKVRIMTGEDEAGTEWNELLYRVSECDEDGPIPDDESWDPGNWEYFGSETLGHGGDSYPSGRSAWMQESDGLYRVTRGISSVSSRDRRGPSTTGLPYGWRPVLELIQ